MFFIFGIKKFGIKKDAYKITDCKNCDMPRMCIRKGWSEWGHFFFIPLLPFGHNFSWECSACGKEPKTFRETSIGIKIFVLLFVSFITFAIFKSPSKLDINLLLGIKVFLTIFVLWVFYSIVVHSKLKRTKELKNVIPLDNLKECKICSGVLIQSEDANKYQCSDCKCIGITKSQKIVN